MKIFLSYSSKDRDLAQEVQLALVGYGYDVFFDKASLPPGGDYRFQIEKAVEQSDFFIFLISPSSTSKGSYALTELNFARRKWPHPKERVLPVRLRDTPWEAIDPYLKSVTILEPEGDVAAEVAAAVGDLKPLPLDTATTRRQNDADGRSVSGNAGSKNVASLALRASAILFVCLLGGLAIANWSEIHQTIAHASKTGTSADTHERSTNEPVTQVSQKSDSDENQCPEVTVMDFSKHPPGYKKVRRCNSKNGD